MDNPSFLKHLARGKQNKASVKTSAVPFEIIGCHSFRREDAMGQFRQLTQRFSRMWSAIDRF